MSELNDAIKHILIANGFEEVDVLPFATLNNSPWDYQYHNGEYYIYFDKEYMIINARYSNGAAHELYAADAKKVIEYLTEHGKAPEQEATKNTEQAQQFTPQQLDIIKTALQEKLARAVQVQVDIEATLKTLEGYSND